MANLNRRLLIRDHFQYARRHNRGGKHGNSERETERIRFIHFLCEAARLVALTGKFLKPTPRAARWLTLSSIDRTQLLFAAFVQTNRRMDALWRAYRLPGFQIDAPQYILAPLLHLLRDVPLDYPIRFTTLRKLIPFESIDDAPENQPATIMRGIVQYLAWLGVIDATPTTIRLTDLGAHLLQRRDAPTLPRDPKLQPLKIDRSFQIIAPPHADLPTLYELAEYADLISVRPRRKYRLNRDHIHRALARGATFTSLSTFFETAIDDALPRALVETLQQWAQEIERVKLRRVTILETRDRETLEQLTRVPAIRKRLHRTLSPRVVTLRERDLPMLIRTLVRYDYAPRVELPDQSERSRTAAQSKTRLPFNNPTIGHLYLAARLGYHFPELIPAHYRVPYSIVLELEKQSSEHDHTVALELIEEMTNDRRQPMPDRRDDATVSGLPSPVELIEQAIGHGTPLRITYYTASRDETTTRTIEPYRIEWRGNVPYLIAYCHTRQDERVFRVDRIRNLAKVLKPSQG